MLRTKPGRPDGLAPDKGCMPKDKTIGLVGWLTVGEPERIGVGRRSERW
jgi:hypothetical protein